jgi:hypothetical protein
MAASGTGSGTPSLARAQRVRRRGNTYVQVIGDNRTVGGKLVILRSFGRSTGEAWSQARLFEVAFNEARRLHLEKEASRDEILAAFGQLLGLENVGLACQSGL